MLLGVQFYEMVYCCQEPGHTKYNDRVVVILCDLSAVANLIMKLSFCGFIVFDHFCSFLVDLVKVVLDKTVTDCVNRRYADACNV
jgi:hypothetical protein